MLPCRPDDLDPVNIARLQALEVAHQLKELQKRKTRQRPLSGRSCRSARSSRSSRSDTSCMADMNKMGALQQLQQQLQQQQESLMPKHVVNSTKPFSRMRAFKLMMRRVLEPDDPAQLHALSKQGPPVDMADLYLKPSPSKSKFSTAPYQSDVPVLRRLTGEEVGRLERWMVAHVKLQYVEVSAAFHAVAPKEELKQAATLKLSTTLSLLKRYTRGKAKPEEARFLFARLHTLPLLCDVPNHLLPEVAKSLEVRAISRGVEVFRRGAWGVSSRRFDPSGHGRPAAVWRCRRG